MKRRMTLALVLAMSLSAAFAMAEETNSLKDFTSRLKGGAVQTQTAEPETPAAQSEDESSYGKPVKIEDPFFQKVRSSTYLTEDKYSREANVMIEVKNVSGRTLYPRGATVSALNAAGEVVEEESYSNCAPDMVENGESMFIWDWFYGFETPIDEIAGFAVTVESETSTYTEYQKIDAQGMMMAAGSRIQDVIMELEENLGITMPEKLDQQSLQEVFGLNPDDIEEYYGEYSAVNTSADHIIGVKVKDGKVDEVKSALESHKQEIVDNFEEYLPDQYDKAQAGKIIQKGNYLFLVIAGDSEKGYDSEMNRAQHIIDGYFE